VTAQALWQLNEDTAKEAGALLARAFIDEPIYHAAFPDRAEREQLCPPLFAGALRYGCRCGEAWAAGIELGQMRGVLYWVEMPDAAFTPELLAALGWDTVFAQWGEGLARIVALEEQAITAISTLPERWRYLQLVGVEPGWQGKGLGTMLLRHAVASATAAATPLCLVTDRVENVPLYHRVGFELAAQGVTEETAVRWWAFCTPISPLARDGF
jgi:GNAT superfamily N-acetyltransferase